MSRNLLHKKRLEEFKAWLLMEGITHRAGRGDYDVLQVQMKSGQWQCVFDRLNAPEHYTVAAPLEPLVRRFINARAAELGRSVGPARVGAEANGGMNPGESHDE